MNKAQEHLYHLQKDIDLAHKAAIERRGAAARDWLAEARRELEGLRRELGLAPDPWYKRIWSAMTGKAAR